MTLLRNLIVGCAAAALMAVSAAPADAGLFGCFKKDDCCCEPDPCCEPAPAPVCCPPAPVEVTWCVTDPVTCCKYQVSACVPACCQGETPCLVGCKKGFLGRKILTYKFPGCGHCVDVVVTKHGRTIVRD